jgi:GLPGLI family protein
MIDFQIYSYQTDDALNWKLTNETKKYQGFNLQKATTNMAEENGLLGSQKIFLFQKRYTNFKVCQD